MSEHNTKAPLTVAKTHFSYLAQHQQHWLVPQFGLAYRQSVSRLTMSLLALACGMAAPYVLAHSADGIQHPNNVSSIEACSKLLPLGYRYNVTISVSVDSSEPYKTEAKGRLVIDATGKRIEDGKLDRFIRCVEPLIYSAK